MTSYDPSLTKSTDPDSARRFCAAISAGASARQAGRIVGIPERTAIRWAKRIGAPTRPTRKWTEAENDVLRREFGRITDRAIGALLGRSEKGIGQHARDIGLHRATNRPPPPAEADQQLQEERRKLLADPWWNWSQAMKHISARQQEARP